MSNNTPDYRDDLFFDPEISWTEQKKWIKNFTQSHQLDYREHDDNVDVSTIVIWKNGDVSVSLFKIVNNVSYNKQREIIKTLFG